RSGNPAFLSVASGSTVAEGLFALWMMSLAVADGRSGALRLLHFGAARAPTSIERMRLMVSATLISARATVSVQPFCGISSGPRYGGSCKSARHHFSVLAS